MRKDKALARRERDLFYTDNFGKTWSLVHGDMTSYNVRWTPFPEEHPDVSIEYQRGSHTYSAVLTSAYIDYWAKPTIVFSASTPPFANQSSINTWCTLTISSRPRPLCSLTSSLGALFLLTRCSLFA
jgi:hypothetical protein